MQKARETVANWADEIILVKEAEPEKRLDDDGFPEKKEEEKRTIFCNKKSVGYSEYFKSQQTGKVVEAKCACSGRS